MADLTNGIDQLNSGPPVGPPALNEFFFGREYENDSDYASAPPKNQVSFSNVYVGPINANINTQVIPMTNVQSGQSIILAIMGEPNSSAVSPTFADTFATHYTWTLVTPTGYIGSGVGTRAFMQLWIGTGGSGDHGVVTITNLPANISGPLGVMAYSARGASTAKGLLAIDYAVITTGQSTTPNIAPLTPSYNGEGIVSFAYLASATVAGNILGPSGASNDILPTVGSFSLGSNPAVGGTLANVQNNAQVALNWVGPNSNYWVAGAIVLLPLNYPLPNQSPSIVPPGQQPGLVVPPIGPPALNAQLFGMPFPTEVGPDAPAHVPNTASSQELFERQPQGEMLPPIGPPALTAFIMGRDTSGWDVGVSAANNWVGVASLSFANLSINATSQRTVNSNAAITFANVSISSTSQRTVIGVTTISSNTTINATSQRTTFANSTISIAALSISALGYRVVSGTASINAGAFTISTISKRTVLSISTISIASLNVAALSQRSVFATSVVQAGPVTIFSYSKKTVIGSSSIAFGATSIHATSIRTIVGVTSISIASLSIHATGVVADSGVASLTLGDLTISTTSKRTVFGVASISASALSINALGVRTRIGTSALAFGSLSIVSSGHTYKVGVASINLNALTISTVGARLINGVAIVTSSGLTISAIGDAIVIGIVDINFGSTSSVVSDGTSPGVVYQVFKPPYTQRRTSNGKRSPRRGQ